MRRGAILALCLLVAMHAPSTMAEPPTLVWEHDVGPGLITTSPLVDEDQLYVRTSKSWSGEDRTCVRFPWTAIQFGTIAAPPFNTT